MKAEDEISDAKRRDAQASTPTSPSLASDEPGQVDLVNQLRSRLDRGGIGLQASVRAYLLLDPAEGLRQCLSLPTEFAGAGSELGEAIAGAFEVLQGRPDAAALIGEVAGRLAERLPPRAVVAGVRALDRSSPGPRAEELLSAAIERSRDSTPLVREMADRLVRAKDVRAHDWLLRLARLDPSGATALRAYRSRAKLPKAAGRELRIAILSSYTIDSVVAFADLELRALGLVPSFYVAPFDTWEREVLDPASGLRKFEPEISFLSVSIDDLAPELAGTLDAEALSGIGDQALDRLLGAVRRLAGWSGAPVVVHGFHLANRGPLGILEGRSGPSRSRWLARLNGELDDGLGEFPRAYLLDMTELLLRRPGGPVDHPKLRHMGAVRLGEGASGEVARAYGRYVAPLVGRTRKCVVLDLDNTLWGGVVGEVGAHGIKLAATGPGSEFQEFQRYLAGLGRQGILLAINSKNNPEDAWEAIRSNDAMILREEHFSAVRINWKPKPENLVEIARELDIGIDSLIFVDDNPNERERVRQFLPQVLVPELPSDPSLYRSVIEALPELQRLNATEEDAQRVQLYREKRERESARENVGSVEEYLATLQIKVEIARVDENDLPRVHQLFHRTNQFNTTTRRYELGELEKIAEDRDSRVFTLRASDRFGSHGLVALALVRPEGARAAWRIDSFLMSCRVIGYGIETALLAVISEDAVAAGKETLVGEFRPTAKNSPAADFYARHGFDVSMSESMSESAPEGDMTLFERDLASGAIERPAWLTVERRDAP